MSCVRLKLTKPYPSMRKMTLLMLDQPKLTVVFQSSSQSMMKVTLMGDAIRIYDSVDMNVVMGNGGTLHHSSKVRIQEVSSLYGMKFLLI